MLIRALGLSSFCSMEEMMRQLARRGADDVLVGNAEEVSLVDRELATPAWQPPS